MYRKISIVLLSALLLGLGSCRTKEEVKAKAEVVRPVKTFQVGVGQATRGKSYPARTQPGQDVRLSFRVPGSLQVLNLSEGQSVRKGQLLASLDKRDFEIRVTSTRADYEQAKLEMERYKRLWEKEAVAENEYDLRVAKYLNAEAAYQNARNALKDSDIFAPFSGSIGVVGVENHEEVRSGELIATIYDLSSIEVSLHIPESMLFDKEEVQSFQVYFEEGGAKFYTASLKELGRVASPEGFPVTLVLDRQSVDQEDHKRISGAAGFTVRVNIIFRDENAAGRIVVPVTAVMEPHAEKQSVVWVLDRSSMKVNKREVELAGFGSPSTLEIASGLEQGEWIVSAGIHHLKEGQQVKDLPGKL